MTNDRDKYTVNITSHGQQGGITAHTVNIGPQQRSLSSPNAAALKQQILTQLSRAKPITVFCIMGDTEGYYFGMEIHAFMKANGFTMAEPDGISQGVFTPPPKGLSVNDKGSAIDFLVGSAN